MMPEWFDAVDHEPDVLCEVQLASGERHMARFDGGAWTTQDGQSLEPVLFRPDNIMILTAVHEPPEAFRMDDENSA